MGQGRDNGCGCAAEQAARLERRTLWAVLAINAAMFVVELGFGLRARSTGLIADSIDMLADAAVYLFSDRTSALADLQKHQEQLKGFGIPKVRALVVAVNTPRARVTHAPLPA